ncbi:helix-turn-helix domain-containing protein [Prosthecobacter vanneervenii]|uniref:Uncharacterized protein n=1 Tax=Prosthecobacter vanneervenii TaxID=48466 RepID=A0A7W8DL12_9BACT|nr:helix-turn-helix domain-containing protein [Prosthecobacter vanneervenii]MBB5033783.1 hypothetical protein [Prosthecobacter vanneervenii]
MKTNLTAMKKLILRSTQSLLQTLAFTGLSAEQSLLATIVSQNPTTDRRVRQRAQSLLLLDGGATSAEVSSRTSMSRRSLGDLIQRFRTGGLCAAILGAHASPQRRAWLTLSPSSAPRVQLQRQPSARRAIPSTEAAAPSAAEKTTTASRIESARCCCHSDHSQAPAGTV